MHGVSVLTPLLSLCHYATQQLAELVVRLEYQLHHSKCCCRPTTQRQTPQDQWQNIADAIHSAAESTIVTIPPTQRHKHHFCPELAQMSAKQRDLRLRINNTTDNQQWQQLKQQHNSVLHAMRRKALANASAILDERAKEVERLHDGALMLCAICLLCHRPHLQAVVHD